MKTTTFLIEKKKSFTKLKNFYDLSVIQSSGDISYIDKNTQESIPSEVHELYIISFTGNFRDIAYGYAEKYNLKLFEACPDCIGSKEIKIHHKYFKEQIKPIYTIFKRYSYQERFLLSKEFKGCQVYKLEYFLSKNKKFYWKFRNNEDEYFQRSINYLKVNSN